MGELVGSVMPLLSSVFDKVEKSGNDYTLTFAFSKVYEFLKSALKAANVDLDAVLPDVVKNALPKEMTFKAVLRTNGTILTGLDVLDAELTTNDGKSDGTFNLRSNFNLFGEAAAALDVAAMVPESLKDETAVPVTKILNLNTHGEIVFEKSVKTEEPGAGETPAAAGETTEPGSGDPTVPTVTVTRTLSWKLVANLDLFRLLEKNFVFDDPAFADNFFHLRLEIDGEPVLELAFAPEKFNSHDVLVVANAKKLVDTLFPGAGMADTVTTYLGENVVLPINTTALGYMLSGKGGEVEAPLPAASWYQPAYYEAVAAAAAETPADGEKTDIVSIIKNVLGLVSLVPNQDGAKELTIDVAGLEKMLGLTGIVKDVVESLFGGGETARFTGTEFRFGETETAAYDVKAAVKQGKLDAETGEPAERNWNFNGRSYGWAAEYTPVTDDGFVKFSIVSNGKEVDWFGGKDARVTLDELNFAVGAGTVNASFVGKDMNGTVLEFNSDANMYCMLPVTGYIGLDPNKIGEVQRVTFTTGIPDTIGIIVTLIGALGGVLQDAEIGIDAKALQTLFFSTLKLGSFEANIVLSEASYQYGVYSKAASLDPTAAINPVELGDTAEYDLVMKATYRKNAYFKTDSVVEKRRPFNGDSMGASQVGDNTLFYLESNPMTTLRNTGDTKDINVTSGEAPFRFVYRGLTFEKVYRFEEPSETKIQIASGYGYRNYTTVSETKVGYKDVLKMLRGQNVYAREGAEDVVSELFRFENYHMTDEDAAKNFRFVNSVEMTGMTEAEIAENGFRWAFAKEGAALFDVLVGGKVAGRFSYGVIDNVPQTDGGKFSDVRFTEEADGTFTMTGLLTIDFGETGLSGMLREAEWTLEFERVGASGMAEAIPEPLAVTVDGSAEKRVTLAPDAQNRVALRFEARGLVGTRAGQKIQGSATIKESKITGIEFAKLQDISFYSKFAKPLVLFRPSYGKVLPKTLLVSPALQETHLILFLDGKYELVDNKTKSVVLAGSEVEVGMYDANGALIEGGIDAEGKIAAGGTLKVTIRYNGEVLEAEKTITAPAA